MANPTTSRRKEYCYAVRCSLPGRSVSARKRIDSNNANLLPISMRFRAPLPTHGGRRGQRLCCQKLRILARSSEGRRALTETSGLGPRALGDVLAGRSRPRHAARRALAALVDDVTMPPEMPQQRRCAGCGEPLTASNPQQRYCSRACQQHAYRTRRQSPPPLSS